MINRFKNISPEIKKSFNSCDDHYAGMSRVYREFITLLAGNNNPDLLLSRLKQNLPIIKTNDPFSYGIVDGHKKIETMVAYLKSGQLTLEEVKNQLESEVERMQKI